MALLPLKGQTGGGNSAELKTQLCDMIRNGKRLSQGEARKAFSQYLGFVLKRLSSMPDNEGQVEIVIKFLQKASKYLRTPFLVKVQLTFVLIAIWPLFKRGTLFHVCGLNEAILRLKAQSAVD